MSGKRLRLAALNAEETELKERLGAQRAETARLLAALEIFRRDPPPALFANPHEVKDAVRAAILIRAITPQLEARAQALKDQSEALRQARRRRPWPARTCSPPRAASPRAARRSRT